MRDGGANARLKEIRMSVICTDRLSIKNMLQKIYGNNTVLKFDNVKPKLK